MTYNVLMGTLNPSHSLIHSRNTTTTTTTITTVVGLGARNAAQRMRTRAQQTSYQVWLQANSGVLSSLGATVNTPADGKICSACAKTTHGGRQVILLKPAAII